MGGLGLGVGFGVFSRQRLRGVSAAASPVVPRCGGAVALLRPLLCPGRLVPALARRLPPVLHTCSLLPLLLRCFPLFSCFLSLFFLFPPLSFKLFFCLFRFLFVGFFFSRFFPFNLFLLFFPLSVPSAERGLPQPERSGAGGERGRGAARGSQRARGGGSSRGGGESSGGGRGEGRGGGSRGQPGEPGPSPALGGSKAETECCVVGPRNRD